jgi:N-methylhydantoinase A
MSGSTREAWCGPSGEAPLQPPEQLKALRMEAVGVCLLGLWSTAHELRVANSDQALPGVPFTLSHQLNPTLREYRRAWRP